MKFSLRVLSTALLAVGLASCGGGGGSTSTNPTGITSVRVFGDSLADSGTFGLKFTVNMAGPGGTATPIWPELVAKNLGVNGTCNFFNASSFTTFIAPTPTCKNFAVGGGRINNQAAMGGAAAPFSIPYQMDVALSVVGGKLPSNELIMLDGGGNDSADLIGAYIAVVTDRANTPAYIGLLSTLLPPATVNDMIALPATTANPLTGAQQLGGLYMVALANKMADVINSKLLANGATKVALVNAPAVTGTPRFKSVLRAIAASPAGAAGAAGVEALSRSWTQAFNATLQTRLGSDARVAIVDLYTDFDNQVSSPAQFGLIAPISQLTGVTDTACPITGLEAGTGLPEYKFATCTDAALNASPIAATWKQYGFSDGFHPTPYGHVLASQLLNRVLATKGWL
jgi:outer membrane lipase/esterase